MNFETLAVALSRWVEKEPPPMCAPKALMAALHVHAIRERPATSVPEAQRVSEELR